MLPCDIEIFTANMAIFCAQPNILFTLYPTGPILARFSVRRASRCMKKKNSAYTATARLPDHLAARSARTASRPDLPPACTARISCRPASVSERLAAYNQQMTPHFGARRDLRTLPSHSAPDCGDLPPAAGRPFGALGNPPRGAWRGVRSPRRGRMEAQSGRFWIKSLTISI
jgi:hypothetical protein